LLANHLNFREVSYQKKAIMKKENQPPTGVQISHFEFNDDLVEKEIWLTTEGAMAHLKVSRSTIYRLRKKQNIPSTKIGHIPIYPKCLLNTFLINRSIDNVKE
jgi:predicted metal-dependent phosphotriesterase family hydrolase